MTFEDESDAPTKIVHYTYDVHDRLIQKSVDLGADDDIDRAEYYRYDGTNVWFEAIDAGWPRHTKCVGVAQQQEGEVPLISRIDAG